MFCFALFCLLDWTIEEQVSSKTFLERVIMSVTVCGAASGKCDLYSIKQYKYKYNEGHLKYKVKHQAISGSKNNLFFYSLFTVVVMKLLAICL